MKFDLDKISIKTAHQGLITGKFSVRELVDAYLAEIEKNNTELNAYLEVFKDGPGNIDEQVVLAEKKIADGKAELLTGIPFAIKDNILIKGRRAGSASKILEGFVAPYDASVIEKLKSAGAIFLGRVNMDEFAMGGSNENSAYGPVKNPYDTSRVSGGSSGGSAVAVSANMAMIALGSDTGGSIRQPASLCGIVGIKPTYGTVSRYGLMAMGSSLDQISPIAKKAEDVEIVLNFIKGRDKKDGTTLPDVSDVAASAENFEKDFKNKKMVIGVPRDLINEGIDKDVLTNFEGSLARFRSLGYTIKDITLPHSKYALPVYYIIMFAESSSNLARFDGMRFGKRENAGTNTGTNTGTSLDTNSDTNTTPDNLLGDYIASRTKGFGKEVRRRILLGNYILSSGYYDAYYNKAQSVRELLKQDYKKAFEESGVDVVLTPTSPTPAFKIGEKSDNPLQMYLADIFTVTANLTSLPAISIPSGFAERDGKDGEKTKLPLGIQLTGDLYEEAKILHISKDFLGEL